MLYLRIFPCVSLEGGGFQVTIRLVELAFETLTFNGSTVGARKKKQSQLFEVVASILYDPSVERICCDRSITIRHVDLKFWVIFNGLAADKTVMSNLRTEL